MSFPIIPTKDISTKEDRSAPDIIEKRQPPREQTASGGSSIQVKHLNILDPLAASEWENLVQAHPDATVFHSARWAQVISATYGHAPVYLTLSNATDRLALVPLIEVLSPFTGRRAICLPFTDACDPLLFQKENLSAVVEEVSKIARQRAWKYFEIRGGSLPASAEMATTYYGHKLSLPADPEQLFERFTSAARRAVRKGQQTDLDVRIEETSEAVSEFYKIHVQTRKRHGVPPQPVTFFSNIHEKLIRAGLGFVVLVRMKKRVVAGALFLRFGRKAIYKFAASDPRFGRSRGNNLVLWEGIQYLIRTGCDLLDFGRTSLDNEGLRRFKLSWGAQETMIPYYRFDPKQEKWITGSNRESGLHVHLFRHLPSGLNRMAGAILYPHLD